MTSDGIRAMRSMRPSRVVALALVAGVFFTAQEVFMDFARRRPQFAGEDVANGLRFWIVWAMLTPGVVGALRRWPLDAKPMYRPLAVHAVIAVALATLHNLISIGLDSLAPFLRGVPGVAAAFAQTSSAPGFVAGLFTGVVYYTLVVMVATTLRFRGLYAAEQLSAAALQAELTQSKLDTLRAQLRPHFLFNTLNAISVFVMEDAAKAQQMILRLSTLLRRSLDEEANEVPLREELTFVSDYLDIQHARFGDRLSVRTSVEPAALDARVPVFLLQPLLENAIEHGKSDDRCTNVVLSAARDQDALHIALVDDGPGVALGGPLREGVGLANTRARLRHLYGHDARVELGPARETNGPRNAGNGTRVDIRLPFRATGAGVAAAT